MARLPQPDEQPEPEVDQVDNPAPGEPHKGSLPTSIGDHDHMASLTGRRRIGGGALPPAWDERDPTAVGVQADPARFPRFWLLFRPSKWCFVVENCDEPGLYPQFERKALIPGVGGITRRGLRDREAIRAVKARVRMAGRYVLGESFGPDGSYLRSYPSLQVPRRYRHNVDRLCNLLWTDSFMDIGGGNVQVQHDPRANTRDISFRRSVIS